MSAVAKSITSRAIDLAVTGIEVAWGAVTGLGNFQNLVYAPGSAPDPSDLLPASWDTLAGYCRSALSDSGLPGGSHLAVLCLDPLDQAGQTSLLAALADAGQSASHLLNSRDPFGALLNRAHDLLQGSAAIDAVLLCGLANGGAVLVLENGARAVRRGASQYAVLDAAAWAVTLAGPPDETMRAACAQSMHLGLALPPYIGLLEITGSGSDYLPGLQQAYEFGPEDLTCALSTLGLELSAPLHALARLCLCLSRRFIPGLSHQAAAQVEASCGCAPFYLPDSSRAWFRRRSDPPRAAGLAVLAELPSHLILREAPLPRKETPEPLAHAEQRLIILSAGNPDGLTGRLDWLQASLDSGEALPQLSAAAASHWTAAPAEYNLTLLASGPAELAREIAFARTGLPKSFATSADWQTPAGSYFTPRPLGREGQVAFVYPGAFNSYTGVGKDLLYDYPRVFHHLDKLSANVGRVLRERLLYPRATHPLTQADLDALDAQLSADAVTMLSSGTTLSVMYTLILQDYYQVQPGCAFGYSLGETSMLFAFQVWANGDVSEAVLHHSPLFRDRLAGPRNTVRERWGMPPLPAGAEGEDLWANFIVMAAPDLVTAALKAEERVYLTHINTPRQVVIGGDPAACQRVIAQLHVPALRAPFDHVLHCAAMSGEYDTLVEMNTWSVYQQPAVPLYSAAHYAPLDTDPHEIARSIAAMLCSPLDFTRLTRLAYENGARLFVELGAGSNCSRWIDETLKDQPHAAFSMDRKGLDDRSAILRAVARLLSHAAPINPGCLFSEQLSFDQLRVQLP